MHSLLWEFDLFEGVFRIWIDLNYTTAQSQQRPVGRETTYRDGMNEAFLQIMVNLNITSVLTVYVDPAGVIDGWGVCKRSSDGLNCACPNLSEEKGQGIPRGVHWVRSALDKFSSHLVRGQSDNKNEFDVTQTPISVTRMCLPLPQIKMNHGKP